MATIAWSNPQPQLLVSPMTQTLYNCQHSGDQYRVSKFVDGNVESSYLTDGQECNCPAGVRPTCRHRQMFPELLSILNTHWFLEFDSRTIVDLSGVPKNYYDEFAPAPTEQTVEPAPNNIRVGGPESSHDLAIDLMAKDITPLPTGVQVFTFGDPATLFNAIADAVGEPRIYTLKDIEVERARLKTAPQPFRRRL